MQRRHLLQASAAALAAPFAHAQPAWPTGPVRIVVGFPPGGGTDALARVVAAKLTTMWNQQVIVETKAGAAGILAAEYVAQQPSDGSTLLMAHINSHALGPALQPTKLRYSVERDFVPLCLVGVTPNLLIASPGAPAKNVKDVVAACKAAPALFSTSTVTFHITESFCPTTRASASVPPPGGKPTMMRTGPLGHAGWACTKGVASAAALACSRWRRCMGESPRVRLSAQF